MTLFKQISGDDDHLLAQTTHETNLDVVRIDYHRLRIIAFTQTANFSRRILIEIPFYRAIRFHCLRSERMKISPCDIICDISHGTSNGIVSDESARRVVRYYYFNFTAEPSLIYLGARLMSLEDCPRLGVNADRRSERACGLALVRTSYSSTGFARPTCRSSARRSRSRIRCVASV